MPRYDYRCRNCLKQVEVIKPISELDNKEPCPACEHLMERFIAPVPHRWDETKAVY